MSERQGLERSSNSLLLDIIERLAVVEQQLVQVTRSQNDADDSRRSIHSRLNSLSKISDTVERLEPVVIDLDKIRQRAIGGQFVIRVLWTGIGAMLLALGGFIDRWWHPFSH